ncbi:hypothetical protein GE09DRAFT_1214083 [Coniochaeta sp. 2T2.1]|nr:hypothetical protein GE09DRAFT_1214083 [Coniochaeta sp. 2T2.1]
MLQKTCLVRVSGAWKNTGYEMLLKELNIERLAVYLRRTAVAYRARALTTPHGNRLGHFVNESLQLVDKPREYIHLHPFYELYNEEAIGLVAAAEQELRMSDHSTPLNSASVIGGSTPPDSDPVAQYAAGIEQQKRLKKKITQIATRWSKSESSRLWDKYQEGRIETRPDASKYAIFQEGWGNSSLSYYKNLNRAQSTMLMRCRTGYIGLKRRLYVMKKADTDLCDCKTGRQTVPHLFLFCPHLADARAELRQKLGHSNLNRLLSVDAAVAMDWAIRHFGLKQPTSSEPDSDVQPPKSGPNLLFEAG